MHNTFNITIEMYCYYKTVEGCADIRNPKVFSIKNKTYIIGSIKHSEEAKLVKYAIKMFELIEEYHDNETVWMLVEQTPLYIEFDKHPYLTDINLSAWIRNVKTVKEKVQINLEIKENVNQQTFVHHNYLVELTDLNTEQPYFSYIKKYDTTDFLFYDFVSLTNQHIQLTSEMYMDATFIWGTYLMKFYINEIPHVPKFDAIVDYKENKGHAIHNIIFDDATQSYTMIFSIRHHLYGQEYQYKIYSAQTRDFMNFNQTQEIEFIYDTSTDISSRWFCYPNCFTQDNCEYMICNQDDYGKSSKLIVFKKSAELCAIKLHKMRSNMADLLNFGTHRNNERYIYHDEITKQCGKRYEEMMDNLNKNTELIYTSHAPSCSKLTNVLNRCNISSKRGDAIMDMGCGRGYALALMSAHKGFKKVAGIEINEEDVKWCRHNVHEVLGQHHVDIIHDDVLQFNDYASYNYFYFYNPFGADTFNQLLKKMYPFTHVIYHNIHEQDKMTLNANGFSHVLTETGVERDYQVWIKEPKKLVMFGTGKISEVAHYHISHETDVRIVGLTIEASYLPKNQKYPMKHNVPIVPFETLENAFSPQECVLFAPCDASEVNRFRERIYNEGKKKGFRFYSFVSSKANIYTKNIGDNCFILENNTIQPYVRIGNNCILWSGNHIGHHSTIEDHVFVTSQVVISGICTIGKHCYLGVNSAIKDGTLLPDGTVIGMSASVTKSPEEGNAVYVGIPAKLFKRL